MKEDTSIDSAVQQPEDRSVIGRIEALFRYPVKSMRGEALERAELGFHGIVGDRRFAFRRTEDRSAFPWLSASSLPELLLYTPVRRDDADEPSHVRTPSGAELPILCDELAHEISRKLRVPVEMLHFRNGIFDDASLSVIASTTIDELSRLADREPDVRRFRPNVLVRLLETHPFREDAWVGGILSFGDASDAPAVAVTARDVRCSMINFDPETASVAPEMMKTAVRVNANNAGVYGTVIRTGLLEIGQRICFRSIPSSSVR